MTIKEKLIDIIRNAYLPIMFGEDTIGEYHISQEAAEMLAEHLIAKGVTIPVLCKDCSYRRDNTFCPMCFVETIEWDDDGYTETDFVVHDHTYDCGWCNYGEE